jgi:uncharacterized membrane-anchored protein/uncharacterized membrane protein
MKSKFVSVQLGYVLGVSSLLTAIIYFFATNWGALNRAEKFVPVFMLILGFYGVSVWLSRKNGRMFLSRLSLFACCVSFGVGIAVIGQTYNSHADSYSLFAIWMIPALLFGLLTRWQPFYILAYILGHLAYSFYFFPKWWGDPHAERMEIAICLVVAIVNSCLYVLTERERLHAPFLKWISFQVSIGMMLWISNSAVFEHYGVVLNLPLIVMLAAGIFYTHRTKNKMYLLFAGLWVSVTITMKYIELASKFYNEFFFIGSLLFVILFVAANVKFLHYIRIWNLSVDSNSDVEAKQEGHFTKWVVRVLTVSVIIIGTLIGSLSLIGLVTVVLGLNNPENVLIGFGLIAVIGMITLKKLNSLVRYTLLCCGFLIGAGTAAVMDYTLLSIVFLLLTGLAFVFVAGTVQRIFFFLVGEVIAAFLLYKWLSQSVPVFMLLTVILFIIFAASRLLRHAEVRKPLLYTSYPSFLLSFFILTFITESGWYYASNVLFFLTVVLVLFISRQLQVTWIYRWGLAYWIAFLVYKYYDLAWKLLHKSVSFAIIGALIIIMTVWYENRNRLALAQQADKASMNLKCNRLLIAVLVLLQLSAMSLQIGKSEYLLANGQLIKLQLIPLDPRSIMQGDYVRLRYAISEPQLPTELKQSSIFNKKAVIVLAPNDSTGVYEYRRVYTNGEKLGTNEIRINGTIGGFNTVDYGIETYFVPEGTGHDYERNARYAEVKVSAGGDAILVRLLLEKS